MSRELRGLKQLDEATGPKSSLLPPEADKLPIQDRFVPQKTTLEPPKPNSKRWVRASAGRHTQLSEGEGERTAPPNKNEQPQQPQPAQQPVQEDQHVEPEKKWWETVNHVSDSEASQASHISDSEEEEEQPKLFT
jgi:hypothetical protein